MSDIFTFGVPEKKSSFMRNYTRSLSFVLLTAMVLVFNACTTEDNSGTNPAPSPNMLTFISSSSQFSLFNAAVNRANLTSALTNPNITVFAPDNTAWGRIGISSVSQIEAIPVSTLQSTISYHIVSRRIAGSAIPVSDSIRTLNSQNIYASNNQNGKFINGFRIGTTDFTTSNGLLHVIDRPLTPPLPNSSISSIVANDTTFSFLFSALTRLNLVATFNNPGKYTVFAPTNAAFRTAGITDVNAVPLATLDNVVKSHVVGTNAFASDIFNGGIAPVLSGRTITFAQNTTATQVKILYSIQQFSNITRTDIVATNGVIHVISRVMLP
jgi:uncharacterized surface protein with fasciclin (FAS1) repeats